MSAQLIPNCAQQPLAPSDPLLIFDALGFETVDHAEDAAALFTFGDDHLGGVGGGAEDVTDFGHVFDGIEHVDRVEAFAQEK